MFICFLVYWIEEKGKRENVLNSYIELFYLFFWEVFLVLIMGVCVVKLSRGKDNFCYKIYG